MNNQIITDKEILILREGFIRMSPKQTNIPIDIFVNEDNISKYTSFPIIVLFRNSYEADSNDLMPLSVSDNPIMLSNKKLNISNEDYCKIVEWVIKHKDLLIALSEERLTGFEFLDEYHKKLN